jgi:hypothetical protein
MSGSAGGENELLGVVLVDGIIRTEVWCRAERGGWRSGRWLCVFDDEGCRNSVVEIEAETLHEVSATRSCTLCPAGNLEKSTQRSLR